MTNWFFNIKILITDWLFGKVVASIQWENLRKILFGRRFNLSVVEDWHKIFEVMKDQNVIILTRRKAHFTTYLISLAWFGLTGRFGYWAHAAMNVEHMDATQMGQIDIMEATAKGVHRSKFWQVFDCDSVCLLKPRAFTKENWQSTMADLLANEGKPYDNLFNYLDDHRLSCVELVYDCLVDGPNVGDFSELQKAVMQEKTIHPQMIYESSDFEILLEIRK